MKKLIAAAFAMALATAAQADAVKLFDAVPITFSGPITTGTDEQPFSDVSGAFASDVGVYVVCDAASTATISSNSAGTGSVVVDNFLTMNGGDNNICTGISQNDVTMCFNGWNGASFDWYHLTEAAVLAAYPTPTFPAPAPYVGVGPLTVSLKAGGQLVTFERWDTGGILASTDLWFSTTNCSIPPKVSITHFANGKTLCIGNSAVKAHVEHGDDIDSIVIGCAR